MNFSPEEQRVKTSRSFQYFHLLSKTELKQLQDIFPQYQLKNLAIGRLEVIAETRSFIKVGDLNYSTIGNIHK